MGLLGTYVIYKAGKRRAQKDAQLEAQANELCKRCRLPRREHSAFLERCPD